MANTLTIVPLDAVPNQSAQIILGGQNCKIHVFHKSTGVFFDLYVDGEPVILGRICRDRCRLVRYEHITFQGDLFFADMQGSNDPEYTGLGDRYQLFYASENA